MKQSLTSGDYSKAQAHENQDYARQEEQGSGEILREEIDRAKLIHARTGKERFCDRYKGTDYCLRHCTEDCAERR